MGLWPGCPGSGPETTRLRTLPQGRHPGVSRAGLLFLINKNSTLKKIHIYKREKLSFTIIGTQNSKMENVQTENLGNPNPSSGHAEGQSWVSLWSPRLQPLPLSAVDPGWGWGRVWFLVRSQESEENERILTCSAQRLDEDFSRSIASGLKLCH